MIAVGVVKMVNFKVAENVVYLESVSCVVKKNILYHVCCLPRLKLSFDVHKSSRFIILYPVLEL